jgi:hypothetical protein
MSTTISPEPSDSATEAPATAPVPTGWLPGLVACLFVLDLFLPWSRLCLATLGALRLTFCTNVVGWRGLGGLAGAFAISLVVLWAVSFARTPRGTPRPAFFRMTQTLLAVTILGSTIVELMLDRHVLAFGAWIGLALAVTLVILAFGASTQAQETPT